MPEKQKVQNLCNKLRILQIQTFSRNHPIIQEVRGSQFNWDLHQNCTQ